MVKGSNLLEGLLNKEVSRGKLLKAAGIGLGLLAAGACAAENSGSAGPTDPTADTKPVPRPTPEAATPTPVETAKPVEQEPLPDPEQLISRERAEKLFEFPNWKSAVAEAGSEKAAADSIAEKLRGMVDGILNPLSLVSEEDRAELGLGQRIQNEELNNFRENLQKRVTKLFLELTTVDPTQGSIPESMAWLAKRGGNNTLVALTQCGNPESLNGDPLFSRTVEREGDLEGKGKVLYLTIFPTQPHKIRIGTSFVMRDNLDPESDSTACQELDRNIQKDSEASESKFFVFDFTPPEEEGPMRLIDFRIKDSVNEP
ncbi:hypothetical protein [Candidatus Nanosynsacchari sp. TM7_ANC_38.39_G1_1]|uniref:hypothetical protein n=1 Tax=Candidatus Nanosynsacchari sp. TM7_ANC_38.39_G1_1 TaxID=1986206 RepID=UPI00101B776F|nr:hypothetical protein [Candidatus Nanosynsacchari sp. TM7_ANC_38.39_G1_1]RYC74177.1 hypothetical protein G1ANC_00108 [Candidatus Nanosynsacchari sp. TM7_ANC_38.39_G1_1]